MSRGGILAIVLCVCSVTTLPVVLPAQERPSAVNLPSPADSYSQIIASRGKLPDTVRLERLISLYLSARQSLPRLSVVNEQNVRWIGRSASDLARAKQSSALALEAVQSISETRLPPSARLDWRFLLHILKGEARLAQFPTEYLDVSPDPDLQLIGRLPRGSRQDYEEILTWLRGVPFRISETLDTLRQGLVHGAVASRNNVRDALQRSRMLATADPASTSYLVAFRQFPPSLSADEQKILRDSAVMIYRTGISPAYAQLADYLENTYLPASQAFPRMSALPRGTAWYAAQIWTQTGVEISPQEIHRTALAEVRRTQGELEVLALKAGFSGTYNQFILGTRRDPICAPLDADGIRIQFQTLMQQVEVGLPKLFGTIPITPYEVVPAPSAGSAIAGSLKLGRPGQVRVQTPFDFGVCDFVVVVLHEALPGHLLQRHIEDEFANTSDLRRQFQWRAFTEGWGNYAGFVLPAELGLKLDSYQLASRAKGEMFMAARTVIETGIHLKGWSRDQAIDYYKTTIGWAQPETIDSVIDVAANQPGSYLVYLVGQQRFTALRARAERALGSRFDIRMFHDEMLRNGPLPFDVLDAQIGDWIAAQKRNVSAK